MLGLPSFVKSDETHEGIDLSYEMKLLDEAKLEFTNS